MWFNYAAPISAARPKNTVEGDSIPMMHHHQKAPHLGLWSGIGEVSAAEAILPVAHGGRAASQFCFTGGFYHKGHTSWASYLQLLLVRHHNTDGEHLVAVCIHADVVNQRRELQYRLHFTKWYVFPCLQLHQVFLAICNRRLAFLSFVQRKESEITCYFSVAVNNTLVRVKGRAVTCSQSCDQLMSGGETQGQRGSLDGGIINDSDDTCTTTLRHLAFVLARSINSFALCEEHEPMIFKVPSEQNCPMSPVQKYRSPSICV